MGQTSPPGLDLKIGSMIRTSLYTLVIVALAFAMGYLYATPDDMMSLQQPQSVVMHLDSVSIDMPETYMQMSVDHRHPDTLVGWYDTRTNTVRLKFIVLNNLGAYADGLDDSDMSDETDGRCLSR
jgi:hypothetical protein